MQHLRRLVRSILIESSHLQNLASLLVTNLESVNQGVELGQTLDVVHSFEFYPLPFDEGYTIELETDADLAEAIERLNPNFFEKEPRGNDRYLLLYVVS